MSENQSLEIIENKLNNLEQMLDQQSKSGVFFDGFTKQVLENIHNKLEYISNFETNELITYLTEEMKRTMDDKHNVLQLRLDSVQGLINSVQANMAGSLKTPEVIQAFNKLSDGLLDFSRELNIQTQYFNASIESIRSDMGKINVDNLNAQTNDIRNEVSAYKTNLDNFATDMNAGFDSVKNLINSNGNSEALVALSGDVSIIQKGLNDIINAVVTINSKQAEVITAISGISASADVQDIRLDVSSMLTEIQVLQDTVRVLVSKSDLEAINEKLNYAIEAVSNIKELNTYNDNENKTIFRTYFSDLTNMLTSLVSKEESEFIKGKLDFILSGIEDGKQDVRELIEKSDEKIAGILSEFSVSKLATKDNLNDFSLSTLNAINAITTEWNDKIVQNSVVLDEKLNGFKSVLSSIYEAVSDLSSKVSASKEPSGGLLKEDISELLSHIEATKNYIGQYAQNVDSGLSTKLSDVTNLITEKTVNLENLVGGLQEGLKNSLSDNISQLKDFSQNLVVSVSDFASQLNSRSDALKSVLDEHYNLLSEQAALISQQYYEKFEEVKTSLNDVKESINAQVAEANNQYDTKFDDVKTAIGEAKEALSWEVASISEKNNAKLEEMKSAFGETYNALNERISASDGQYDTKFEDVKTGLTDSQNAISAQVTNIEEQLGQKSDEIKSILNERYSNISNQVSVVSEQYSIKTEELKVVVEDRYNSLSDRIAASISKYAEFAGANKEEIINELSVLKDIAQASKSALQDEKIYALFDERIMAIASAIQESKNEILTANLNITEAASGQISILDTINNSVKDLCISISDSQSVTSAQKEEIINDISQKIYDLSEHIETLKAGFNNDLAENKTAFQNEIETVKNLSAELKTLLNEINENQASKQILAAILESVTGKVEEVSNLISTSKDLNLEQYDSTKQLYADIKNNVSDIIVHLNQSSEFSHNLLDRLSAGFVQTVEVLSDKTNSLKEELEAIRGEQKTEVLEKVNAIQNQLVNVQNDILNFNFDESVKEQLLELKNQIESFNQQSLVDVLNKITENNEQTGQNVQNAISEMKTGFESLSNKASELESQTNVLKDELIKNYNEALRDLSDKVEIIFGDLESNSYNNKEQILNEVANLQNYSTELQNEMRTINENMLKSDFVVAQTDRIGSLINDFVANFTKKLDEISNIDKSYIEEVVKESFDEFQQQIANSINYLKSLNLNLDRSFSSTQNAFLEGLDALNGVSGKAVEEIGNAKSELSSKIETAANSIAEIISNNAEKRQQVKEELSANISNISQEVKSGFEQAATTHSASKDEVLAKLNEVATVTEESRMRLESNQAENKQELLSVLNNISDSLNDKLIQSSEQSISNKNEIVSGVSTAVSENTVLLKENFDTKLQDTFARFNEKISEFAGGLKEGSSNNKEQILSVIEGLKASVQGISSDINELLSSSQQEIADNISAKFETNTSEINEKLVSFGEELKTNSSSNKDQISEAIKQVKDSLEQFKEESKTRVDGSNEIIKSEMTALIQNNLQSSMNRLESVSDSLQKGLYSSKDEIISEIETIKTVINNQKSEFTQLEQNIEDVKQVIVDEFSAKLEQLNEKTALIVESANNSVGTNNEQIVDEIEKLTKFIEGLKADLNTSFNENLKENVQKTQLVLDSSINRINDNVNTLSEKTENVKNIVEGLNNKIGDSSQRMEALSDEIKQMLGTSIANINDILSSGNTQNNEFQENLKYEFKKVIDEISDKLLKADEDTSGLKDSLLYELQKSYNTISGKVETQTEAFDKKYAIFEEKVDENFKQSGELIREESSKLESSIVKGILESLDLDQVKASLSKDIVSNATTLSDKVDELSSAINENKTLYETVSKSNKNDVLTQLDYLKEDIKALTDKSGYEKLSENIISVGERVERIHDDIIATLGDDIESTLNDNMKHLNDNIEDKISYIKDDIQGILITLSEVDSLVDRVKDIVAMQFENYFDSFDSKIDVLSEDIKKYFDNNTEKITSAIDEYQRELNNLCDIDLSEYSEDTKRFVEEQINELKEQLSELQNSDNLDQAVEKITDTVNASSEVISKHLITIRDIVVGEMPSGAEINDNFDDLRAAISDIDIKTKGIADIVKDEHASLRDVIEKYQAGIEALSNLDSSTHQDDTKGFIKSELKQLKEQFIKNLTSVFENISFIEEAEEIQNVIYDNTDELKNEINKLKQELVENSNSNEDIDEKFNNLKNILESITSGSSVNSGQYLYTLPDVETDIAKMRMAINDITSMLKQSQDDGNDVAERLDSIDDIRDDISSISKRTNKLILTSEDSNKHLRENIAEFKRVIDDVSSKCNMIDNTPIYNNLNDIKALMISSLSSSQTLNEVFMHLAEWIDSSSQTLNGISDKVADSDEKLKDLDHSVDKIRDKVDDKLDEVARIKDSISELSVKLDKKLDTDYSKFLYDIECGLDKLSDKLEVQELKIKSLEKKIDSLVNAPSSNDEITSLLEFIASQATAANENSRGNKALLQKIDMVEKKVEQFEESISKITAFIDGVN